MMTGYLGLAALGVLAYFILWREGMLKNTQRVFLSAVLVLCAMAVRGWFLEYETLDYQDFLQRWVAHFRNNGGFRALNQNVGNYNVPYLYFLALFSYSSVPDLYLIKLLSVLFDVLLAWGALRLARLVSGSEGKGLAAFHLTLLLPTVILNGACWGQCDSIYTAFGLWSILLALEKKPVRSVIAIALSFSFKLQAVFLMPVFLVFLYARRIRWYHLAAFPLTYLVVVLPAVLLGRPLGDTLTLYYDQMGTVGSALNYNSSSVYSFLSGTPANPDTAARTGIFSAFGFLLLIYVLCSLYRERLDNRNLLVCAALISVAVPFLLPHMHDRYFYPADVLSLVLAVCTPALAPAAAAVSFGSLLGYHAYLKRRFLLPMRYGGVAMLAVIAALTLLLASDLTRTEPVPAGSAPGAPRRRSGEAQPAPRKRAKRQNRDYSLQASRVRARRREREKK